MRKKKESPEKVANVVREAARSRVYGLPNTLPSAIYIHGDGMRGFCAKDVLAHLNPPILSRIGIRFWQTTEDDQPLPGDIQASLEELGDIRPGATFSHTITFYRLSRLFGRDPIHIKEKQRT